MSFPLPKITVGVLYKKIVEFYACIHHAYALLYTYETNTKHSSRLSCLYDPCSLRLHYCILFLRTYVYLPTIME